MKRRATWRWLALALGSALAAGCSNSSSAPSTFLPGFIPGPAPTVFAGTVVDSTRGNGTVTVTLTGVDTLTSGYWEMSFGGKADVKRVISGTVRGTAYNGTFADCADLESFTCSPNCHFSLVGSLTASTLSGTYTRIVSPGCVAGTGTVNATKQ